MNDLPYVCYNPRIVLLDTFGMSPLGKVAHRQLLDYFWIHEGRVPVDDKSLREITSCPEGDWGRVKLELFSKGWKAKQYYFVQSGAARVLNLSKQKVVDANNKTCKQNKKPRLRLSPPDPETEIMGYVIEDIAVCVTPAVTPAVTPYNQRTEKENRDKGRDYSLLNKLSLGGLGGVVARILSNEDNWAYDNSKVQVADFAASQLTTVLRTFLTAIQGANNISGMDAVRAWCAAARESHAKQVDGTVRRTAAAVCIDEWKRRLATMAASTPNPPA